MATYLPGSPKCVRLNPFLQPQALRRRLPLPYSYSILARDDEPASLGGVASETVGLQIDNLCILSGLRALHTIYSLLYTST